MMTSTSKGLYVVCFLLLCNISSFCQLPYTDPIYTIRKDSAVYVGTSPNYCNNNFDIKINIYKPVGDNNTKRPVAIFVHGGAFTSREDFNEYHMGVLAQEFAKRGYVTASIDYREGHHLYPYGIGSPYPIGLGVLLDWTETARLFVTDSAEVIRSAYRAQQDIKGVVRFMKSNHLSDSSCTTNVFLVGHSAGAISVLAAGFIDQPSEKPIVATAIADAANPNWTSDGFWWFGTWVVTQINGPQDKDDVAYRVHNPLPFDYEASAAYTRPDLGDINGALHTGPGFDATVNGIASLCGAVGDTTVFAGPNHPALYMYHQPNDLVVNYNVQRPFEYASSLLSPAPNGKWPLLYGSNWIKNKLDAIAYPNSYKLWTFDNTVNDPLGTTAHDILPSDAIVADSIARFFAVVIAGTTCPNVLAANAQLTAGKLGKQVQLQINLANAPDNNTTVSIERSADGIHFTLLTMLQMNNSSHSTCIDPQPYSLNFYRLKIVKSGGAVDYSAIVVVKFAGNGEILFYPNPFTQSQLSLEYNNDRAACKARMVITDMTGRTMYEQQLFFTRGLNKQVLLLAGLAVGTYHALIYFDDGRETKAMRLVKSK